MVWYACRPFSVVKLRVIKFYPIGLQGLVRFYPRNWISWGGDHLTMHVSGIQLSGGPYQLWSFMFYCKYWPTPTHSSLNETHLTVALLSSKIALLTYFKFKLVQIKGAAFVFEVCLWGLGCIQTKWLKSLTYLPQLHFERPLQNILALEDHWFGLTLFYFERS